MIMGHSNRTTAPRNDEMKAFSWRYWSIHRWDNSLRADAEQVLGTLRTIEREIQPPGGSSYLMRLFPYRILDDRMDGVLLTFMDIGTRRKKLAFVRRPAPFRASSLRLPSPKDRRA